MITITMTVCVCVKTGSILVTASPRMAPHTRGYLICLCLTIYRPALSGSLSNLKIAHLHAFTLCYPSFSHTALPVLYLSAPTLNVNTFLTNLLPPHILPTKLTSSGCVCVCVCDQFQYYTFYNFAHICSFLKC